MPKNNFNPYRGQTLYLSLMNICEYGNECYPDDDYELLCDDHRRDHAESIADQWNDRD